VFPLIMSSHFISLMGWPCVFSHIFKYGKYEKVKLGKRCLGVKGADTDYHSDKGSQALR